MYDFLVGLNRDLDEVRGCVLSQVPFPTIDEAFVEVRREKNHRKVMLSEGLPSASPTDRKLGLHDQKQLATKKEQQQFKNITPRRTNVV